MIFKGANKASELLCHFFMGIQRRVPIRPNTIERMHRTQTQHMHSFVTRALAVTPDGFGNIVKQIVVHGTQCADNLGIRAIDPAVPKSFLASVIDCIDVDDGRVAAITFKNGIEHRFTYIQ